MRLDRLLAAHRDLMDTREQYEECRDDWHSLLLEYFDLPKNQRPCSVANLAYAIGVEPNTLYQTRVRLKRLQS